MSTLSPTVAVHAPSDKAFILADNHVIV